MTDRCNGPVAYLSDIGIVMVTYNSADCIERSLDALGHYLPGRQIVIVDNGSTDGTVDLLAARPEADLIIADSNLGFGAAVNLGATDLKTDWLLCLNPDATVVAVDSTLLARDLGRPGKQLLACGLSSDKGVYHSVHGLWGWRRELAFQSCLIFLIPHELTLKRPRTLNRRWRWISGAAFMAPLDHFRQLGGFNQQMKLYFEDMDLSRRWIEGGGTIGTTAAIVVAHEGLHSSGSHNIRSQAWALLSIVEMTASRRGTREGHKTARMLLRTLTGVEAVAHWVEGVPILGSRAHRKKLQAQELRRQLLLEAWLDQDMQYREARAAVRAAALATKAAG